MNWDDVRIFCTVARTPTFSAAARHLDASVATVARRIDALEATLGVRLVDRARQGVRLTTHGRALFQRAAGAATAMDDLGRLAASLQASAWPDPIRVSATEPLISELLAPALPRLFAAAPELRVDLSSTTDIVSLAARQADVAVRFARPVGDSLVIRRLPSFALALFASRAYLGGRRPASLDLRRERMLGFDGSYGRIAEVAWMEDAGLVPAIVARSSSVRALLRAAAAGAGIAILPRILTGAFPELVEVPSPTPIPARGVWVVTHRDLRRAKPLRLVRDWIADSLARAPERQ